MTLLSENWHEMHRKVRHLLGDNVFVMFPFYRQNLIVDIEVLFVNHHNLSRYLERVAQGEQKMRTIIQTTESSKKKVAKPDQNDFCRYAEYYAKQITETVYQMRQQVNAIKKILDVANKAYPDSLEGLSNVLEHPNLSTVLNWLDEKQLEYGCKILGGSPTE